MAYGNWNNRNSGGNTPMQGRYGDFGSAINGGQITQNYYDAVAQYREAQRQAYANMAQTLKAYADNRANTGTTFIAADKYKGNQRTQGVTPGKTDPQINAANQSAGIAQDQYKVIQDRASRTTPDGTVISPMVETGKPQSIAWLPNLNNIDVPVNPNFTGARTPVNMPVPSMAQMLTYAPSGQPTTPLQGNPPDATPAEGYPITAYGVGTNDQDFANKDVSTMMSNKFKDYVGTQKGMADFMQQMMDIEANQGTRMDMTGNFAMEDPKDIRATAPAGMPTLKDIMAMPENIDKQWASDTNTANAMAMRQQNADIDKFIGELSAQYPQESGTLQTHGYVSRMPDGTMQFTRDDKTLKPDARGKIDEFWTKLGTAGQKRWIENKFNKEYNHVNDPSLDAMLKPKPEYRRENVPQGKSMTIGFRDGYGNVNDIDLYNPDDKVPDMVIVRKTANSEVPLYHWKSADGERIFIDPTTGEYRHTYKAENGKMVTVKIPKKLIFNTLKSNPSLKPELDKENGKQGTIELSALNRGKVVPKGVFYDISDFQQSAANNNPSYLGRSYETTQPQGEYNPQDQGGTVTQKKYIVTTPEGGTVEVTKTDKLTSDQQKQVKEQEAKEIYENFGKSWLGKQIKKK
jgi:hypothetical protein